MDESTKEAGRWGTIQNGKNDGKDFLISLRSSTGVLNTLNSLMTPLWVDYNPYFNHVGFECIVVTKLIQVGVKV